MTDEELQLAAQLIEAGTLTLRHLQLGMEWSTRTGERFAKILSDMAAVPGESLGKAADRLRSDSAVATRRRFQRHETNDEIEVVLSGDRSRVRLIDISLGGLSFSTDAAVEVGATLSVLADGTPLPARVRHCTVDDGSAFAGVEFEPRDVEDLTRIENLLGTVQRH